MVKVQMAGQVLLLLLEKGYEVNNTLVLEAIYECPRWQRDIADNVFLELDWKIP